MRVGLWRLRIGIFELSRGVANDLSYDQVVNVCLQALTSRNDRIYFRESGGLSCWNSSKVPSNLSRISESRSWS